MFVALCDDDPEALAWYSHEVVRLCADNDIPLRLAQYETGAQLLFAFDEPADSPDIVLLDIGMPKIDGIQTAERLRERGFAGAIVFVTARDDRMLDAFDVGAFNYVVKGAPVADERFARVFLEAVRHVQESQRHYLLCNGISEHRRIALDSIRYFSMNRHVCTVHYGQGQTFEFVSTMGRLESMLAASGFVRIQRSYLVNCAHVSSYTFRICRLDDGAQLSVGRKHAAPLREMMESAATAVVGRGA